MTNFEGFETEAELKAAEALWNDIWRTQGREIMREMRRVSKAKALLRKHGIGTYVEHKDKSGISYRIYDYN
jgi:hypothetical protein